MRVCTYRRDGNTDTQCSHQLHVSLSFDSFTLDSNSPDLFVVQCRPLFYTTPQQAQSDYSSTNGMDLTWAQKHSYTSLAWGHSLS